MKSSRRTLYAHRRLSEHYPDLQELYDRTFKCATAAQPDGGTGLDRQLEYLGRLVDVRSGPMLVVGCGPQPRVMQRLVQRGYDVVAVEPVPAFVRAAGVFLDAPERVVEGVAERIPLPTASVQVVYCNSVLEHVDSPRASLQEMARVLMPGGAALIFTTNRYRFDWRGDNCEYTVPFLNWFPAILRECFAFHQLHYDPSLANYSDRPAVHWFSWADLCRLGRDAGFAHFYSTLDLFEPHNPPLHGSVLKQRLVALVQESPWLRSLALTLTYFGGSMVMLKRNQPAAAAPVATQPPEVLAG
jgi:SAM-dependent methyltransferase